MPYSLLTPRPYSAQGILIDHTDFPAIAGVAIDSIDTSANAIIDVAQSIFDCDKVAISAATDRTKSGDSCAIYAVIAARASASFHVLDTGRTQ